MIDIKIYLNLLNALNTFQENFIKIPKTENTLAEIGFFGVNVARLEQRERKIYEKMAEISKLITEINKIKDEIDKMELVQAAINQIRQI